MARLFVGLIALVVVAMVMPWGLQAALQAGGERVDIANETFTPTADTLIVLNGSRVDGAFYDPVEEVTVRDENGTVVTAPGNYTWFQGNGTLEPQGGSELGGDANATITYGYDLTTDEQRRWAGALATLPDVLAALLPVGGFVMVIVVLRGLL